jgi:hypothetical protein
MRRTRPRPDTFLVLLLLPLVCATSACQSRSVSASSAPAPHFAMVKLVRREAQGAPVPVGKSGTVTAACQPGEQLLSGGYDVYAFEGAASVVASHPSAPDAWTVTDDNTQGPSYVTISAYATCLQAPYSIGIRIVSSDSQSPGGALQATTAACPDGAVVTGGGFQGGAAFSKPVSNGWEGAVSGSGKVFALCATERLRAAPATSAQFTTRIVFGSPQGGSAHCKDGQIVTGGGYSFEQGETFIAADALAPDATSWVIGAAGGYNPVTVVVWAACVIAPQS